MGLAREYSSESYGSGPLLINELYASSKISSKVFALYLSNNPDQSTFELGGFTNEKMRDSADLTYITMKKS